METKNPKLLRDSMDTILKFREKHSQGSWITPRYADEELSEPCGTTMCLAGFVAVEAGAEEPTLAHVLEGEEWFIHPDGSLASEDDYWDHDDVIRVNRWASNKLGLNYFEREYLFYFFGDADELEVRVNQVIGLWEQGKEMTDFVIEES